MIILIIMNYHGSGSVTFRGRMNGNSLNQK